jgi:Fur family transcriptional regulator, ferric uptake regulator
VPEDYASAILRECGLKQTAGRIALLKVLLAAGKPLSHKEIRARMLPLRYDPVSVYRSLETFIASGIVHRVEDENRTWLFALCTCDGSSHCHPHFFCRSCGKCECLKDYQMPEIPGLQDSHIVEEKRFYVKGVCGRCAALETLNR